MIMSILTPTPLCVLVDKNSNNRMHREKKKASTTATPPKGEGYLYTLYLLFIYLSIYQGSTVGLEIGDKNVI